MHIYRRPTASSHYPRERDVLAVRALLLHHLPLELAEIILDLLNLDVLTKDRHSLETHTPSISLMSHNDANFVYLVTPPNPSSQYTEGADSGNRPSKVQLVRFSLSSRNQGWGGEPNLQGTW
jgi:hypothetical protein